MIRRTTHTAADAPLDPEVAAELDALERALAGDPGADPTLAALVADVRDDAPAMTPGFALRLDAAVSEGFPRASVADRARALVPHVAWRPALAVAATVLVGLVVTTAALRESEGGSGAVSLSAGESSVEEGVSTEEAAPSVASDDAAAGGSTAPASAPEGPVPPPDVEALRDMARSARPPVASTVAPPAGGTTVPNPGSLGGPRRVERSADLTLRTEPDDVQSVSDRVVRTTVSLGGVVASSRVDTQPEGGEATFDLRLPTSRLDRAIRELSGLADVAALSQASDDITGSFVSAQDRLDDARDERTALLRVLSRATTDRQVASLRARIADSRRRISRAEASLRALRSRTDRATVAVTVLGVPGAGADEDSDDGAGAWTPGDALDDALRVLEVAAGVAVVALAVAVPLGLLALLGLVVLRTTRRRARERALGTPPGATA